MRDVIIESPHMNDSIAEQTKMGWIIMSAGRESGLAISLYRRTSVSDFDFLSDIDVLGGEENHRSHAGNVYKKFKQQLEKTRGV